MKKTNSKLYPRKEAFYELIDLIEKRFPKAADDVGTIFALDLCEYAYDIDPKKSGQRHICLQVGRWCWKNLMSNPGDFRYYFNQRFDRFFKRGAYAKENI